MVQPPSRRRPLPGRRSPTSVTTCHRCSAPVVPAAVSCPWCGVPEPGGQQLSTAVLGAWLLTGAVSLSVTTVLVEALTRAIV